MATRTNWAKMSVSVGGTGSITLASVSNFPTFAQKHGAGSTSIDYVIYDDSTGVYEAGTGSYNGTTHVLSSRTVVESYSGGTFGTDAIDAPTTAVVISAPTATSVGRPDDGDYGAFTISSGGTAATINANAVESTMLGGDVTSAAKDFLTAADLAARVTAMGVTDGASAQTALGLGTAALQDEAFFAAAVHDTSVDNITEFDIASRTEGQLLQVDAEGNIVAANPDLSAFGDVSDVEGSDGDFLVKVAGAWTPRDAGEARSDLGVSAVGMAFGWDEVADGDYTLCAYAPFAGTITALSIETASGTVTANVKIGGVSVTGLSAVAVTSTLGSTNATAANTFSAGGKITVTFSSASSPTKVAGVLRITR